MRSRLSRVLASVLVMLGVAVAMPATAQAYWYGPPQNLTATDLGGGRTQFSWSPPNPANYMGMTPTSYWVTIMSGYRSYYCEGSSNSYIVQSSSCVVSGLPYGVSVTLTVEAWNPYMSDDATATFTLCCALPSTPTAVSAAAGNTTASVRWAPPANAGPAGQAFTYTVTMSPGGVICTTAGLSCDIGGLTNGVAYTFSVTAGNKTGTSPPGTSAPVTPIGPPSPPTGVVSYLKQGSALVTWQGPADTGGAAIDRYVVVSTPDGLTCESPGDLQCTVEGLSNGKVYSFTVTAFNAAGQSEASAASSAQKLLSVPSAPRSVRAQRSGTTITVTWKAPNSSGGTALIGYTVTASPTGRTCRTSKALVCRFSSMKVGATYSFNVQARNRTGAGLPARSNPVFIPVPPPPPPPPKQEQSVS